MKRYKIITILTTVLLALFCLIACDKPQPQKEVVSIKTEYSQYVAFAGCFEYDTVNVITVYNNGETTSTPLTEEMLSEEDQAKQYIIGEHTLTVAYHQMQCTFVLSVSEDTSVMIAFEDKITKYNGMVQEVAVENLPQGATVSYMDNANIDAGVYTVQAVVTLPGGRELSYQSTLTIEKAPLVVQAKKAKTYVGYTADFGYDLVGLLNGEDASVLTTEPIREVAETVTEIGVYENYVVYSGAEAQNYEITYVSASFEIFPLPQAVKQNGKDYLAIGSYPQTVESDANIIAALNVGIADGTLIADGKGYYHFGDQAYAKLTADSYVNGESYNLFTNGEKIINGKTYYFRVEPLQWRVLKNETGSMQLMAEMLIDVRPFWDIDNAVDIDGVSYNPNNYEQSGIRGWLNGEFMEIAFESYERVLLIKSLVQNGVDTALYQEYDCEDTQDYVFLPSYQDITNAAYGFKEDADRMALTSDYVRALGTYMCPAFGEQPDQIGYGSYYLRSSGCSGIRNVSVVHSFGDATNEAQSGSFIVCIRPMLCLSL